MRRLEYKTVQRAFSGLEGLTPEQRVARFDAWFNEMGAEGWYIVQVWDVEVWDRCTLTILMMRSIDG